MIKDKRGKAGTALVHFRIFSICPTSRVSMHLNKLYAVNFLINIAHQLWGIKV